MSARMTPFVIEVGPLSRPTNRPEAWHAADRALAEAGRALLGTRGMTLVLFPDENEP